MRLLCFGYYDKFSRFFIAIEKELQKKHPTLKFKLWNVYFSGYFYGMIRNKSSFWISFSAWTRVLLYKKKYLKYIEKDTYKGFSLEKLVAYQLQNNPKVSKTQLLLQAVSYISCIDHRLKKFQPDLILMIGDSRLSFDITQTLAKRSGIPVRFIEQGPFGTTVFDHQGVNANASIRNASLHPSNNTVIEKKIQDFLVRPKAKKYKRSYFYRGVDYFLEFLLNSSILYPPDLKGDMSLFGKVNLCKEQSKTGVFIEKRAKKHLFLLICQVPFDVNMTHHSPHFSNHFSILKNVHENMPKNGQLIVREHPIYKGRYESKFYQYIRANHIEVDCHKSAAPVMKKVDVVVVNNSTVGLEAIAENKVVVVLGNAYYDSFDVCLKLKNKKNLGKLLKASLKFEVDPVRRNIFFSEFIFHHLIEGFITDKNLIAAKTIAHKIGHIEQKNT